MKKNDFIRNLKQIVTGRIDHNMKIFLETK